MKIAQRVLDGPTGAGLDELAAVDPQLVLVFGDVAYLREPEFLGILRGAFPQATLAGCSTAGEICSEGVYNGRAVVTAVHFEATRVASAFTSMADGRCSTAAGERLGRQLGPEGLTHVLLFGPGVQVNGSGLIEGLRQVLPPAVTVSGGLAGDNGAFVQTFTLCDKGACPRGVVAVGLYGDRLQLGHGSFHGWIPFGPLRRVSKSDGNLLYELDGEPALYVYKRYLGEYASQLPASGLLFPFEMVGQGGGTGLIRTILGVDESQGMLILAGDVEQDGYVRLMHANTDSLVNGAQAAAESAGQDPVQGDSLAILVSCVGRKLVMGARVDEEVEAVLGVLGKGAHLAGFYSYGEISPVTEGLDCRLHNQTMTITRLSERA
jgi:hypothetical protein